MTDPNGAGQSEHSGEERSQEDRFLDEVNELARTSAEGQELIRGRSYSLTHETALYDDGRGEESFAILGVIDLASSRPNAEHHISGTVGDRIIISRAPYGGIFLMQPGPEGAEPRYLHVREEDDWVAIGQADGHSFEHARAVGTDHAYVRVTAEGVVQVRDNSEFGTFLHAKGTIQPDPTGGDVEVSSPATEAAVDVDADQEQSAEAEQWTDDKIFASVEDFLRALHDEELDAGTRGRMMELLSLNSQRTRAQEATELWENTILPTAEKVSLSINDARIELSQMHQLIQDFVRDLGTIATNISRHEAQSAKYWAEAAQEKATRLVTLLENAKASTALREYTTSVMVPGNEFGMALLRACRSAEDPEDPENVKAVIAGYRKNMGPGEGLDNIYSRAQIEFDEDENIWRARGRHFYVDKMLQSVLLMQAYQESFSELGARFSGELTELERIMKGGELDSSSEAKVRQLSGGTLGAIATTIEASREFTGAVMVNRTTGA